MQFFARLRSRKKKGGSRLFRYGWKVTLLILLAGAGFAIFLFYGTWAQTFDMKNVGEMPERNTVYDVDGKIYSRLAGANRLKVSLSEVSPYFITAVLAREDVRFTSTKELIGAGFCVLWSATSRAVPQKKAPAASRSSLPETVFRWADARLVAKYWKQWWRCAS